MKRDEIAIFTNKEKVNVLERITEKIQYLPYHGKDLRYPYEVAGSPVLIIYHMSNKKRPTMLINSKAN